MRVQKRSAVGRDLATISYSHLCKMYVLGGLNRLPD